MDEVTPDEIAILADRAGLVIPAEDLLPVARTLNAHMQRFEPLMALELSQLESALVFDPRWRD